MKCSDLRSRGLQVTVIDDYIVSDCQPLIAAGLRCEYALRLQCGFRVSRQQAADLTFLVAIDDENAVDKRLQGRFDQEWYYY